MKRVEEILNEETLVKVKDSKLVSLKLPAPKFIETIFVSNNESLAKFPMKSLKEGLNLTVMD